MQTYTMEQVTHTFEPIYNKDSQILILGSFPSVKSRETDFYYGHPRNRFWSLLSTLLHESLPLTIPDKKTMLLNHHIAIWDVIQSCEIHGSSDASIRNVVPADLNIILNTAPIETIYANGATAYKLYNKYCKAETNREIIKLPSTSPANAAWNMERLLHDWNIVKHALTQ